MRSVADQQLLITQCKELFGNKPITATEWNFQLPPHDENWAAKLQQQHPFVAANLESAFYYKFIFDFASQAGPAGLVDSSYHPHDPFYSVFKSWHQS
jgi:hypothetical protein